MLAISTNLMLALRKASFQGFLVIRPLARISWKIGVSCSWSRNVARDGNQKEGPQERHAPRPCVKCGVAEISARRDDHCERHDNSQRWRSLQPACVIAAPFVRDVFGNVSDGAAVFAAKAQALHDA